ncbi:TPA: hypothetical protein ACRZ3R_005192 [Vibrio harveyi]|uniref:hypothetical protein n=1 Tax=Vibrio jasicida TaxID=766224 RepID=UPI000CE4D47C|nr:hypothetical protein [Vibrio jasicida]
MNKIVVGLILSFVLVGCSNLGTTRAVNGNIVQNIEDPNDFGSIAYVDYYDVDTLRAIEKKKAELAFEEPDYSKIPVNGYLLAHVKTPTIESADTKWWKTVVVDEAGNVLAKKQGSASVASYETTNGITVWKNSMLVVLPEVQPPFNVYIVSDLLNKRWGYKVLGEN